ncbi:hypothetical protein TNCV_937141 [Trichonephila clavipes]|nr:hypothetical protein TNCV_937141 [Trichonephila clavipes]
MVSDGTEFAVGDIEKLFGEARKNTKAKHEKWAKYYNRRRRDVWIRINRIGYIRIRIRFVADTSLKFSS